MTEARPRLFSPLFFVMCGFSFTVFVSAFMLLPTAPFHILDLGGTTTQAGLFLGMLTFASALSAPLTGALADRVGRRRMLITSSLVITGFSLAYAIAPSPRLILTLVAVHGLFWSGLLSASAAYMTDLIPENRRAEGIGYWGLSTIAAIAFAPTLGFWVYARGWEWLCAASAGLNLVMAGIAARLHEEPRTFAASERFFTRRLLEWRVLAVSLTLFLYSYGYGGITSFAALYADRSGVHPKGIYLTVLAGAILISRPIIVPMAQRIGHRRVFLPCLVLIAGGMALLAVGGSMFWLVTSAIVFGLGFGTAYPVFAAYVMEHVDPRRRGAAFGGILAAFDTGIGTGSVMTGWLVGHYGFRVAFGAAAALAALAPAYFLAVEKRLLVRRPAGDKAGIAADGHEHEHEHERSGPFRG
jgi:MFS family permease